MKTTDGAHDPTLAQTRAEDDDVAARLSTPSLAAPGYRIGDVIGRGGMGEVVLAEDLRIGRQVAIKRMRGELTSDDAVARFLREARVQARLEHPAIVPVHELGQDEHGRPYFTMKRLAGTTLAQVLATRAIGTNELLRALVDVCLAIDFAHARGIVHRDIKPANIMLGDYGEVYVLDWGVARLTGDRELGVHHAGAVDDPATQAGAVLGTPAYMAPEQLAGEPVGPEADVYALGAVLFEVLAGEPLHEGTSSQPGVRRPERAVPPELDALCDAALAPAPEQRPSARTLADRLRSYLDGDRDVERRRALAAEQLAEARAAIAGGNPARRAEAMAAAGRALALDPSSTEAATLVSQLMLEPPRTLPDRLAHRLAEQEEQIKQRQGKVAALNIAGYLAFAPVIAWCGIRDWAAAGAIWGLAIIIMLGGFALAYRKVAGIGWALLGNAVCLGLTTRMFGPFMIVPALLANATVSLIVFPTLLNRPWVVLGAMVAGFVGPLLLEAAGLWERTWWLAGGDVVTHPTAIALRGLPGVIVLVLGSILTIVVTGLYVRSIARGERAARRQLEIQAWHLEQLLPRAAGVMRPS